MEAAAAPLEPPAPPAPLLASRARPLLVKDSTDYALFLTRYGKGFTRDGCFNKYLPRLLQQVSGAQLSWTKVSWGALRTACGDVSHPFHLPQLRHITANGLVPLATAEQPAAQATATQQRPAPATWRASGGESVAPAAHQVPRHRRRHLRLWRRDVHCLGPSALGLSCHGACFLLLWRRLNSLQSWCK